MVVTLATLLVVQVAFVLGRRGPEVVDMEVGGDFPFVVSPIHTGKVATEGSGCRQAFMCSVSCPFCARLADSLAPTSGLLASDPVTPGWYFGTDAEAASHWSEQHGIPLRDVFTVSPRQTGLLRSVAGRVWFTPTRIVLDRNGILRDARPSTTPLSRESLDRLCVDGGIAPRNAEEFVEMAKRAEEERAP